MVKTDQRYEGKFHLSDVKTELTTARGYNLHTENEYFIC